MTSKKITLYIAAIFLFFTNINSFAFAPEKHLSNKKNEEKAQNLFKEIRCLSCEAQSISGSNTEFSISMRKTIRDKIAKEKSVQEIKNELHQEFGEQIFMSAKKVKSQIWIWFLPLSFAIILGWFLFFKRR